MGDSTKNMHLALKESEVPGDVDVFVEYNIPFTNIRTDFYIAGYGCGDRGTAVIVKLRG